MCLDGSTLGQTLTISWLHSEVQGLHQFPYFHLLVSNRENRYMRWDLWFLDLPALPESPYFNLSLPCPRQPSVVAWESRSSPPDWSPCLRPGSQCELTGGPACISNFLWLSQAIGTWSLCGMHLQDWGSGKLYHCIIQAISGIIHQGPLSRWNTPLVSPGPMRTTKLKAGIQINILMRKKKKLICHAL